MKQMIMKDSFPFSAIKILLMVCFFSTLILSCNNSRNPDLRHIVSDEICIIQTETSNMGFPLSMDIVSDTSFIVSDGINVFMYNINGGFIRKIGSSGNANNEYNRPTAVRAYGDSIYVWSSMSLSFLSFNINGTPGAVYPYKSAICDFVPMDSHIIIYTAGVRGGNVLDILSKDGSDLIGVHEASEVHKILCSNSSTVPLMHRENKLFFSPKDSIVVYSYDLTTKKTERVGLIESSSFKVDPLPMESKQMDRKSRSDYLKRSSMAILLFPMGEHFCLMTLEGETRQTENGVSNEDRYFAVYPFGYREKVTYYDLDSFSYWHLFSYKNGSLFFVDHSLSDNDENYYLKRIAF